MRITPGYTPYFDRERLDVGKDESEQAWPPPLEAYCTECRRMVAARPWGATEALIPVRHFRADISGQHEFIACYGTYTPYNGDMRPGMEDRFAAFYTDPRARAAALMPEDTTREEKRRMIKTLWTK